MGKGRRALLLERLDRFAVVGGTNAEGFVGDACVEHRMSNALQFEVQQYLGRADRGGSSV